MPDASGDFAELVWPALFTPEDRAAANKVLLGVELSVRQTVLDEIDWQASSKPIRSPVGLLRKLCVKAKAGEFEADGAHRIATARRELQQRRIAAQAARNQQESARQDGSSDRMSEETRQKLTDLRRRLAGGR